MWKTRISALVILIIAAFIGFFVYASEPRLNVAPHHVAAPAWFANFPFRLGLDLSGGTHLIYRADVASLESSQVADSMSSLRDVIERRVNLFGVSEPVVQIQEGGLTNPDAHRLLIDLPGVTDVSEAVKMIGQTPLLVFKTERPDGPEKDQMIKDLEAMQKLAEAGQPVPSDIPDPYYVDTQLTGKYLKSAKVEFDQNTYTPHIALQFDEDGAKVFQDITKANVGKTLAIYLDGSPISAPVVNQEITGGQAVINGNFTPQEAKQLVGRLNSGALPVPITLISQETIGATLGEKAVQAGAHAAMIGFIAVAIFLIVWYRLSGLLAVIALSIYTAITLALYKLIPVTLTAAGIAGFIISIGMAVDANVLIFERIKEELKNGRTIADAVHAGFGRAWNSIRDSNTSSIITSIILFWFGTSLIKGFALTFGLGVLVSLVSAIFISRIFLYAFNMKHDSKVMKFLFSSGLSK